MPERHQFRELLKEMPGKDLAGLVLATLPDGSRLLALRNDDPITTEIRRRWDGGKSFSVDQYYPLTALPAEMIGRLIRLRDAVMRKVEPEAQCWLDEADDFGKKLFEAQNCFGSWWENGALEEELARR